MPIQIRNPHSVLAALKVRPKDVLEVVASERGLKAEGDDAWAQVVQAAKRAGVRVSAGARPAPDRRGSERPKDEGGRVGTSSYATVKEREPLSVEELFRDAPEKSGGKGLWLALDSLQDPHNIGAIFRTAAFFGVQGVLMTEERSAPLSGAAYDVASGGLEHVPFATHVNLQRAFEVAKDAGLWILGSSEHATDSFRSVASDRPWLLVLGNEERGMRRLTEESCDVLCGIPPVGEVTSLNVSVAAGILISHFTGK